MKSLSLAVASVLAASQSLTRTTTTAKDLSSVMPPSKTRDTASPYKTAKARAKAKMKSKSQRAQRRKEKK